MEKSQSSGEFSESQRAGLEVRQADQDRTLAGMHRLEAMLAAAAPGPRAGVAFRGSGGVGHFGGGHRRGGGQRPSP